MITYKFYIDKRTINSANEGSLKLRFVNSSIGQLRSPRVLGRPHMTPLLHCHAREGLHRNVNFGAARFTSQFCSSMLSA